MYLFSFFFRKLRTVMINWKRYFNLCCSNTVNRGRPILLITRMITDRNGVHLVLLPLCLTEVHPLFFHTKLCAFFHDLIKSLSLYIHRGPQRPQIARALRTRAILVLFNNWSKCFISRWMHSWRMNQLFYNILNPMEIFFLEGFVCWRHERAQ